MVNKVTLIGNLGKDPEVRRLENGAVVAKFSVATTENYRDKNNEWQKLTEWHDVVAWRYMAEKAERDFKKGKLVFIEGKLTTRKWQDKDGNNRYTTEVVANNIKLLERREGGSGFNNNMPSSNDMPAYMQGGGTTTTSNPTPPTTTPATPAPKAEEVTDGTGDDLPF